MNHIRLLSVRKIHRGDAPRQHQRSFLRVLSLVAVVGAGCGEVSEVRQDGASPGASQGVPVSVDAESDAPDQRFQRLTGSAASGSAQSPALIGSAAGQDGASWAWIASSIDAGPQLIRHARGGQVDVTIPIPKGDAGGPRPAGHSGFAVDEKTNSAWLASGLALYRIDTIDRRLVSWNVPAPPRSKAKDSSSADNALGGQEVVTLALEPSGDLLLQVTSAAALVRFQPSTQQFAMLALPDIGEPADIAVAADGTIAVGMLNYTSRRPDTVVILRSGSARLVNEVESLKTIATPSGFLVSGRALYAVSFEGTVSKVPMGELVANQRIGGQSLEDGRVAVPTQGGPVQVVDPAGRRSAVSLSLGRVPCGLGEGSHTGGPDIMKPTAAAAPAKCVPSPQAITIAGDDLYVHLSSDDLLYAKGGTF